MNHEVPLSVFPNTLLLKLRSLHSSLDVTDQVSESYQTKVKLQQPKLLSRNLRSRQDWNYLYVKMVWIIAD